MDPHVSRLVRPVTYTLSNEGDKLDTGEGRLTKDDENRNMSK